jgi:hypothetical protein
MGREDAEATLRDILDSLEKYGPTESNRNLIVAKNTMDEELGRFGKEHLNEYHFDELTRDRLVVHTRQDAAHALCNTISLLDKISLLNRRISRFEWLSVILLTFIFEKVWQPDLTRLFDNFHSWFLR